MNVKWTFRVLLSRQSLYSLACKLFVDNKQGMNCKEKTDNGNKIFVLKVFFVEYKGSYKKNLLSLWKQLECIIFFNPCWFDYRK